MIDLRYLRTLLALRETGSLVEAAEHVHVTQSALSHQIKDLEERIGAPLFIRKSRPIRFTVAGERLLTLADEVIPAIKSAERDLAKLTHGEAGRLHISIECHSCFEWLMPTLDRFRDHWPDVELDLISGFNFAPLPALLRGNLDLVITSDPQPLNGIRYTPLFSYESVLAVCNRHRLADCNYVTAQDLEEETVITYPVDTDRLDLFTRFLDPADIEPANIRTADLTLMIIQLVASGRGVAGLPNWALSEYLNRSYITAKPLGKEGLWCTLYAAYREEQEGYSYFTDFINTARESSFKHLVGIREVPETP